MRSYTIWLRGAFANRENPLTLKISQHATQSVYRLVPLQNFTSSSDIDWNKAITEIDQQLYIKYSLTDEEIAFIESMIKPM